jgi:hypothetical protein
VQKQGVIFIKYQIALYRKTMAVIYIIELPFLGSSMEMWRFIILSKEFFLLNIFPVNYLGFRVILVVLKYF